LSDCGPEEEEGSRDEEREASLRRNQVMILTLAAEVAIPSDKI
jgi:hypothetical protein